MALNPPAAIDRRGKQPLRNFDGTFDPVNWPLGNKPESAPSAITDLSISSIGSSSANLAWSLPDGANGIEVYQQDVTASGAFVLIETLGAVNIYGVTGLSAGNEYAWKVVAFNDIGSSDDSNTVTDTTSTSEPVPTISSVSGTVAQNETLSISGTFTANRNGQIAYYVGDNTAIGSEPAFLDTFGATNVPQNYKHANDFAFNNKTGASIKVSKEVLDGQVGNAILNLPALTEELYLSYEFRLVHIDDSSQGPQIKMGRMLPEDELPGPALGVTIFPSLANGYTDFTIANGGYDDGDLLDQGSKYRPSPTSQGWSRLITYYRRGLSDGGLDSRLFKVIDHNSNKQVYQVAVRNSGLPSGQTKDWVTRAVHGSASDFPNTWVPPRVVDTEGTVLFEKIYLPYYTRGDQADDWWVDCVHINDSLERVEIGNGPDMYTCGKLVQQFMNSRTTSLTEIEFEKGNLLESEDWYLFVTNRGGTPSAGYLIRSAT